ncbi:hypothetical protein GKQ23_10755 [Erwinia sp. E602]|uniref:hypothetical protein n=1 Tax=Erwinia sp. E602 TaxID=2675378 RepID=UPI001BAAA435|nr:hypothetical protein [Erwinia sp. E602]QUG75435.1 hypothetical protein GKQ23_10755 [Erwinia sp. E602]
MKDIDLIKQMRGYAEAAEKNGFKVLTVPLRDLFPLIDRLESAERERDEYRAEIARRDAAAGEPVAYLISDKSDRAEGRIGRPSLRGIIAYSEEDINKHELCETRLYTAAQPSVLPETWDIFTQVGGVEVAVRGGVTKNPLWAKGYNDAIADGKARDCQPEINQRLAEAVRQLLTRVADPDETYGPDHAVTIARAALDAAGVKWEAQK